MTASSTRMTVSSGWNSREVSLNGRRDRRDPLDPGQRRRAGHQPWRRFADLADDRQRRRAVGRVLVRREALREDAALHAEDLGFGGALAHDDEHAERSPGWKVRPETKKQRTCASAIARHVLPPVTDRDQVMPGCGTRNRWSSVWPDGSARSGECQSRPSRAGPSFERRDRGRTRAPPVRKAQGGPCRPGHDESSCNRRPAWDASSCSAG